MNKWLIAFFLLFNIILAFPIKIITFSGNTLSGDLISINNSQVFFKTDNKINKIPISEIKELSFTEKEKENMYFSLTNGYTFKGYLKDINKNYFEFVSKKSFYKINKNDIKIIVIRHRATSNIIATNFGRFHFKPIEIISDKLWKVETKYGIISISSALIQPSFRPDIDSFNKNILYLNNGDYFFYNNLTLLDSTFLFNINDFNIQISKKDILFLKNKYFTPKIIHTNKKFRLNINNKYYFVDSYDIKNNKIILNDKIIENPKINFISNSLVNLYILNDVFYSGLSVDNNSIFISGYSKILYELDIESGIKNTYKLNSFSYDSPVLYKNYIIFSGFRNYLIMIDRSNNKIEYTNIKSPYSSASIVDENKYVVHLFSKKTYLYNFNGNMIKEIDSITSKRSPLINYNNKIIDLDRYGNLKIFDKNLNLLIQKNLDGKTDYYNIDEDNNIYICGPENNFTVTDENGNILNTYKLNKTPSSFPLIDKKTKNIYIVANDYYLYALNNGKILWKKKVGYVPGAGVLTKNYIILNNLNHDILFISKDDGKIVDSFHLGYSSILTMDSRGFLYSASSNGVVAILDTNEEVINQYKFNTFHTGNPLIY